MLWVFWDKWVLLSSWYYLKLCSGTLFSNAKVSLIFGTAKYFATFREVSCWLPTAMMYRDYEWPCPPSASWQPYRFLCIRVLCSAPSGYRPARIHLCALRALLVWMLPFLPCSYFLLMNLPLLLYLSALLIVAFVRGAVRCLRKSVYVSVRFFAHLSH